MRKIPVLTFDITRVTIEQAQAEFARLCAQMAIKDDERLVLPSNDKYELYYVLRQSRRERLRYLPRMLCRKRRAPMRGNIYGHR